MKTKRSKKGKIAALVTVALLLVAMAVMGTIAWLTAEDEVTNTFTVGMFNKPDINPENPDPDIPKPVDPSDPDNPVSGDDMDLDGYIVEPSWNINREHKILPGKTFYKDPYVGIGDGSEEAAVYVYISNPFNNNSVYFKLNDKWGAVTDCAESFTSGNGTLYYTSGLFKYDGTLTKSGNGSNTWTGEPVFNQIIVAEDIDAADLPVNKVEGEGGAVSQTNDIVVKAFLHQVNDADGSPIATSVMEKAAKEAFGIE